MNMRNYQRATTILLLTLTAQLARAPVACADFPAGVPGGVEFVLRDAAAVKVYWAGEYNAWSTSTNPFQRDDEGVWRLVLSLPAGEHEYKFVVDGNYLADPDNPQTRGEYGNSWIKVKADGSVEAAGGGRAPSALNSKLFIGGLYYGRYELEARDREGDRVMLEKPRHDINLAFDLQLNPSLRGEVELNIDNVSDLSEMWRTRLNFQRAKLTLTRPEFKLELFDNVASFASDDPLHLVGKVGTYAYDYGYGARGLVFAKTLPLDLELKALLADAGVDQPQRPADAQPDTSIVGGYAQYGFYDNAGYRDDLALQLAREFGPSRLIYLARAARGLQPGFLFIQTGEDDDYRVNYRTVRNNLLQSITWTQAWTDWLGTELELVRGGAQLQSKDRAYYDLIEATNTPLFIQSYRDERSWDLQKTRGTALVARIGEGRALNLELRHHYQENRNLYEHLWGAWPEINSPEANAWARSYAAELNYTSGDWSYQLAVEQEEFEFDENLRWGDHFWFSKGDLGAGNLWINGNQLPVHKYGLIGFRSASVISQRLSIPLTRDDARGGDLDLAFDLKVASTRLDRAPVYYELLSEWHWRPRSQWELIYNQRFAKYDHDFLDLSDFFVNHFAELSYHVGSAGVLSLGWGVDPYWLDPVSKTFQPHGRREFLAEQGVDEEALADNYQRMGSLLRRAEDALSEIQRFSIEARINF